MPDGTLISSLRDKDGDNVGDGWEISYGFDPCDNSCPNQNDDGDNDGIKDYHEYCLEDSPGSFVENNVIIKYHNMSKWGAQSDRQDIFVEVDWMADEKNAIELIPEWGTYREYSYLVEYKMSNEAKEKVILAFFKACKYGVNITLHIDDGCMGGGNSITYAKKLSIDEANNLYDNEFTNNRKGIFYYCVRAFLNPSGDDTVGGKAFHIPNDWFVMYMGIWSADNEGKMTRNCIHELGHDLGLYHTSHTYPAGKVEGNAKTCMNEDDRYTVDYHSIEWQSLDFSKPHHSAN